MIEWQDRALILNAKPYGNADALVQVLTHGQGRVAGLMKGGQASRHQASLQVASLGLVRWQAG